MNAALSERDVLASLPPPPSALPDYHPTHATDETLDDCTLPTSISDDVVTAHTHSRRSQLPTSAAIASSAARSMAAVARSTLSHSGRHLLSPRPSKKSPNRKATQAETNAVQSSEAAHAPDALAAVAAAAGSLTSGLTSSLSSASSSFGSLLFASRSFSSSNADDVDNGSSSSGADREEEEAAAALAAEEAAEALQQALTRQRMKILEDLVQHRRSDWTYLKAMHEGSNYWLNMALLREQQVMAHIGEKQNVRRGAQFFYLGIGLGTLLGEVAHPELLAMDCCQLLEELEFHFSSSTVQGVVSG